MSNSSPAERPLSRQTAEPSAALMTALDDLFAEIEDAVTSIQGALRHYQQPQDFHFHKALKACGDGHDTIRKHRGDT